MAPFLAARFLVIVAFLGLLTLAPLPSSASATSFGYSREEFPDDSWLWGNLTRVDGQGRIAWDPVPDAEPVLAPRAGTLTFESDPLARPLYLDPSRKIQVDLSFETVDATPTDHGYCAYGAAWIEAELRTQDLYLGGAGSSGTFDYGMEHPGVPATDAHNICRFRLGLEADYVAAGERLTLTLTFPDQQNYRMLMAGWTPSQVRLPLFDPEEALYRMPEVFPRARGPTGDEPASMVVGRVLSLAFIGGLTASTATRTGRRGLLALALVAVAVSGCAAPGSNVPAPTPDEDAEPSSRADVVYHEPGGSGLANKSHGSIVGRVTDRYGYPVPAVHVFATGTPFFTDTDAYGLFSLKDLKVGTYRLRFDRELFAPLERDVQVLAGRIAQVDVFLAYDDSLPAAERPHLHDDWGGRDQIQIFEGTVFDKCSARDCQSTSGFYLRPLSGTDKKLVLPGASEMIVRMEFDPKCGDQVGFAVQDNVDTSLRNWSVYKARPTGEEFRIQLTWEMTDVGHQLFSTWTYGVTQRSGTSQCVASGIATPYDAVDPPEVIIKKLTITIRRGPLPVEPPHPDRWGGATRIPLGAGTWQDAFISPDLQGLMMLYCEVTIPHQFRPTFSAFDRPVPPEATTVSVWVNQSRANGIGHAAALGSTPADFAWELWYKAGDTQPEEFTPGNPVYRKAPQPQVSPDGKHWKWDIPVKGTDPDGIYNKKTAWRMVLLPDDIHKRCLDAQLAGSSLGGTFGGRLQISWSAAASR